MADLKGRTQQEVILSLFLQKSGSCAIMALPAEPRKEKSSMKQDQPKPGLKEILAAELFAKLSESAQDMIIEQLKALLSKQ